MVNTLLSAGVLDDLAAFRRDLHRRPEVSGDEGNTADAIASRLERHTPSRLIRSLGGHGVAAIFDSGAPGPAVMIRCELDGLPILDAADVEWRSEIPGRGHLCGHDGHSTIVCALANILAQNPVKQGRVILLFQPAEETGKGAAAVIEDPAFAAIKPDYAFALHNLPGMPLGSVAIRPGPFNFASEGLSIHLTGRTSHASQPEAGVSPASAMCTLVSALPALPAQLGYEASDALVTLVHARLGEQAFGIAPGEALVMATIRAIDDAKQRALVEAARTLAMNEAQICRLALTLSTDDGFAACTNDREATVLLERAFEAENLPLIPLDRPFRWSEDFGRFGQHCKAAMFVLGSGETCAPLHAPDYDFPDALIGPGAAVFHRVIRELCG